MTIPRDPGNAPEHKTDSGKVSATGARFLQLSAPQKASLVQPAAKSRRILVDEKIKK